MFSDALDELYVSSESVGEQCLGLDGRRRRVRWWSRVASLATPGLRGCSDA